MWKWILKQAIKALAEPIVDAVISALEALAKRSENTIDTHRVFMQETPEPVPAGATRSSASSSRTAATSSKARRERPCP